MYPEDRPNLQKILEKVEENNIMLHRLQRAHRWAAFFSTAKWLVIIIAAAGSYYYLQPFLEQWPSIWQQFEQFMQALNVLK